jgi:hypothetical protein
VGIVPESAVVPKVNSSREVNNPSSVGMVPDKRVLNDKSISVIGAYNPNSVGMVPERELYDKSISSSWVNCPNSVGMVPVTPVVPSVESLLEICKYVRAPRFPSSVGMVPPVIMSSKDR